MTLGKPKLVLEHLTSGQALNEEVGTKEDAANCLMNTGMVHADIGEYSKAPEIYDSFIGKFTRLNLKRRIATTFTKIGSVFLQQNKLSEAKEYLTYALTMHS